MSLSKIALYVSIALRRIQFGDPSPDMTCVPIPQRSLKLVLHACLFSKSSLKKW